MGYWMNRWDSIKAYKAVVRYGWEISHMPAQVELDSPAVSTLSIVHKMEGGNHGQIQAQAGKARRNDRGIREAY